jgi:tRNA-dihydrouridine synthase
MIGRGAVRNPWIFRQVREHLGGQNITYPRGTEVLAYIRDLYETTCAADIPDPKGVQKIKKYANFIGAGIHPEFLHAVRRVNTKADFFTLCEEYLAHERVMKLEAQPEYLAEASLALPLFGL